MKKTRLILLILLMLLLSMALAACGGGAEESAETEAAPVQNDVAEVEASQPEAETETAVEEVEEAPPAEEVVEEAPAEEPIEEEPAAEEEEATEEQSGSPFAEFLQLNEIDASEGLENYQMNLSMNFTSQDENGDEVTQTILADIIYGTNPEVMSMNMTMEGVEEAEEFGNVTMVQSEGTNYMVVPGLGCITVPVEDETGNPFADLADADQALEDVEGAEFEGEETINGVETLHYSFDASNLVAEEAQDVEWVEGHIYLAKEGGYMVRMVMEGEGLMDQFGTGEDQPGMMSMEYNITPIDGPVTVEIPAECAEAGAGNSPYPLLEDASGYSSFGGLVSYQTAVSIDEALTFYDDALGADGWTKDEAAGMYMEGSMANYTYTKDGTTINLMITSDEGEELTSVLIIEGE